MKKFLSVFIILMLVFSITACTNNGTSDFSSPDEAYEAMTNAAEEGDYAKALTYYENGAADSGDSNLINWYYYSLAMNAFEEKGCLGYSYNILSDRCSDLFTQANAAAGDIQQYTRLFDGIYQCGRYYLYFADGKIAVGTDTQLTDTVYCNSELVLIDKVYYWAEHNPEGDDTLLYKLELTNSGLSVTAVNEENDMYSGDYTCFAGQMPTLIY